MPASLPTTIAAQFGWAPIKAWASATAGVTDYAARAVARKRTPLGMAEDLAEFARVATLPEKPTWTHDAPEVRAWPIARLLDYSAPSDTTAVPTWTRLLARRNELAVYPTLVRVGGGVQRGKHQLTGSSCWSWALRSSA